MKNIPLRTNIQWQAKERVWYGVEEVCNRNCTYLQNGVGYIHEMWTYKELAFIGRGECNFKQWTTTIN